jgi:DNA-binding response OmpR family regulator
VSGRGPSKLFCTLRGFARARERLADILLVDDETFLHEIYSDFLQLHGHKVVGIAYNGEEAVALFRSLPRKPDIVIMDQRMPVKSGVDATKEILAIDRSTRVIFSSADIHARKASADAGAVAFVQKPFTLEELLRVLENALRAPAASTGKKG